jgi:glutamate synthase domain-containing protein 2/glutamate synthase domain-containing protein 1/glutamate synthase domain-containing protein 3
MQQPQQVKNSTSLRNQTIRTGSYGLYRTEFDHDSCGVGFIAHLDGVARHSIVSNALEVLQHMEHRGAVGGDAKTGDGAGVMVQIPDSFLRKKVPELLPSEIESYAVGMLFLPKTGNVVERCVNLIQKLSEDEGFPFLGWRDVPVNSEILGLFAAETEPSIKQFFLSLDTTLGEGVQRKLFVLRRKMEKAIKALDEETDACYICSLSHTSIVYKGMLTGNQVPQYFQDLSNPDFSSAYCIVHSRFSTNTLPQWRLAQPFRHIAHNGEINTLRGNVNRQRAREGFMSSKLIGNELQAITPIIDDTGSDSAVFDNVLELFSAAGRSVPHVMMMMIPEAYSPEIQMSADKRAFYEYHSILMEPWDGPAAVVFTDGRYVGATLDRNGLRPARYTITQDGLVILASETGVIDLPVDQIRVKGRLHPGKMFLVDLKRHCVVPDNVIKAKLSRQYPYRRWVKDSRIELRGLFAPSGVPSIEKQELLEKQVLFGYTDEDLKTIITPMAAQGQEAIGSMGNDTGLAVFNEHSHLLFSYFKQMFAQVTNPPIDPLREQLMMSLESYIENESNPLDIDQRQYRSLKLNHPVLSARDMVRIRNNTHQDLRPVDIDITFAADAEGEVVRMTMDRICREAEFHAQHGSSLIILSDTKAGKGRVPIPSLLAVSGLHQYMLDRKLRGRIGIIIETGEVREVFHYALHLAFGCDAISPYIAFSTVRQLAEEGKLGHLTPEVAADNYVNAVKKGLLKTFSRMGISTLHSFFNTQIFEAVGLGAQIIDSYFQGTISRIGGIGLAELTEDIMHRYHQAFPEKSLPPTLREPGGSYRFRRGSEAHYWSPQAITLLQQAARANDYTLFKQFSTLMDSSYRNNGELRGLLDFIGGQPVDIDEVEPVEEITKRFVSAAMSIGSISKEAHETVAIAMNRLGAKSNSGEGGEDPARTAILPNGDSMRSRIKQIASGRFGVTTQYIMSADELQIKMAQGAKPGEGGQLPGNKVSPYIAKIRHTIPGVTLISPPPHHDIYSIEDLAQLISDLKKVNPKAEISVKLVSEAGVGTIASGVVKAKAHRVLISGQNGGTGASPLTAIRHAGLPWELGLAETQQALVVNKLREQVIVQVDGHLKTGRDLAIAALLGAEEFGFGTSLLITLGCMMVRKCHLNTCPFGVASQDPELRKLFHGKADFIVNFLRFVAQELREYMAQLGFKKVEEMVGRVDLLTLRPNPERKRTALIQLDAMLRSDHVHLGEPLHYCGKRAPESQTKMDRHIEHRLQLFWAQPKPKTINLSVANTDRTVGAALGGKIVSYFGNDGLPEGTLSLNFEGSAGQSFGAFVAPGLALRLQGEANDYLGKGLSGGSIVLLPPDNARFRSDRNIICGNVALYGATSGKVFISGMAGERFAVRNSGATAVVEGLGDHGCEYMTGGTVVVLGSTGKNFAAGMSGGVAYVYDPTEMFDTRCNLDMVELEGVWDREDRNTLKNLIEQHAQLTASRVAMNILEDWKAQYPLFVKVVPIEYRKVLERMKLNEYRDDETISATEEVYHG